MTDPRGGRAWADLRARVYERDGRQCAECGTAGTEDNPLQVDHVVALANGGAHALENLQVLCRRHNLTKGARQQPKRVTWWDKDWLDDVA